VLHAGTGLGPCVIGPWGVQRTYVAGVVRTGVAAVVWGAVAVRRSAVVAVPFNVNVVVHCGVMV
jgi:hypothetical protein